MSTETKTWSCDICKARRDDEDAHGVIVFPVEGKGQQLVQYCNDKESCSVRASQASARAKPPTGKPVEDYLRQYQYRKNCKLGSPQSDPQPGSRAELIKKKLLLQPRIRMFIPKPESEKGNFPHSVTINGYRLDLPKNAYIDLPEQVADMMKHKKMEQIIYSTAHQNVVKDCREKIWRYVCLRCKKVGVLDEMYSSSNRCVGHLEFASSGFKAEEMPFEFFQSLCVLLYGKK